MENEQNSEIRFIKLNNLVDDLSIKLIEKITNNPDFEKKINDTSDIVLVEMLYLLVKNENFEKAIIVRDVILNRGIPFDSKLNEYDEQINKNIL